MQKKSRHCTSRGCGASFAPVGPEPAFRQVSTNKGMRLDVGEVRLIKWESAIGLYSSFTSLFLVLIVTVFLSPFFFLQLNKWRLGNKPRLTFLSSVVSNSKYHARLVVWGLVGEGRLR